MASKHKTPETPLLPSKHVSPVSLRALKGRFFRHNAMAPAVAERPTVHVRKNQAAMTADECNRFISAVETFIGNGFFGALVAFHADMRHRMHSMEGSIGIQRFLPWHRVYLYELEHELRSLDPELFLPYWDWTVDRAIPNWLAGFTPTIVVNGNPIHVNRHPGVQIPTLPSETDVNTALANATYTPFTTALESVHDRVHVWVGGTMASIPTAPADPIFWMHHANIDRLWDEWQQTHKNQHPLLKGKNAVMDPWTVKEPETRSIAHFGYTYAQAGRRAIAATRG